MKKDFVDSLIFMCILTLMTTKLIHGDCLEAMKDMPDKSVDLVLTDPPYGIDAGNYKRANTQHGNSVAKCSDYGFSDWDKKIPELAVFSEIFRISKNQIIFGGNYFTEYLKNSSCWLVWDKDNGDNNYADCELVWTSFTSAVRKIKYTWHGMLQQAGVKKEKRVHPTQKPVGVMSWILEHYSKEGDTVLDCFMGSGTTGVACKKLSRDFIGIELDADYFKIASDRIAKPVEVPLF
jgi:DNA modification methylase